MDKSPKIRVAVFAGASGGHLFPALAFAESFMERFPESEIHLITSEKGRWITSGKPFLVFHQMHYLNEFPFPSGISLRTVNFLLQLPRAFILSARCLWKINPHLSVGFGSYVSYPGMMLSAWKKVPTLIHEQNRVPGMATRWLASHVDCVGLSFDGTLVQPRIKRRETVGLPVRSSVREGAESTLPKGQKQGERFSLLVVGGSQGAHFLNGLILEFFSSLKPREKDEIAVIHITGANDFRIVSQQYEKLEIRHSVYPFFEDMGELYRRADLAITRAGANTLFELALYGVPAIVVPYPFAGGHQAENAVYFKERNAVLYQTESFLTEHRDWLSDQVRRLKENLDERRKLALAMKSCAVPDAAEKLVDVSAGFLKQKFKVSTGRYESAKGH